MLDIRLLNGDSNFELLFTGLRKLDDDIALRVDEFVLGVATICVSISNGFEIIEVLRDPLGDFGGITL